MKTSAAAPTSRFRGIFGRNLVKAVSKCTRPLMASLRWEHRQYGDQRRERRHCLHHRTCDILPHLKRRSFLSHKANSRFSFDNTTVLSISELTPCVPRFLCIWLCVYDTHTLVSDIYCGIDIPIVMRAALRTIPRTNTKIFCCRIFVAAHIANLTACEKLIDFYKFFA